MSNNLNTRHIPVLVDEVLTNINPKPGMVIVDATLGGGGHFLEMIKAVRILKEVDEKTVFIGIDQDLDAINRVKERLEKENVNDFKNIEVHLKQSNFDNIAEILEEVGHKQVDRILADLGTSQDQIEDMQRGFSYKQSAPLDMRMDESAHIKAADLVNALTYNELVELFTRLADLNYEAKPIAKAIVNARKHKPILTTKQLTDLIYQALPSSRGSRTKSETRRDLRARVFQALRIAVNHELDSLQRFLPQAFEALKPKGKLVIISFHSGEDRLVKNFFKRLDSQDTAHIEGGLIRPTSKETALNPRSSSSRMRVLEKL